MTERIVLEQLADLVPESDTKRRRVLSNLDKIAQGAIDAVRSYTNKHGDELSVPQPDWNVAVKAMESAKVLLGLAEASSAQPEQQGPTAVQRIEAAAEARLRAVPGKVGGQ